MTKLTRRVLWGLGIALLSTGVSSGCLPLPPAGVVVIERGPPPPPMEPMGPAPGMGYVWIGGYWVWRAGDFYWTPGRWSPHPPGHRYWVPGRWVHTRRGWYFSEGHWD